MFVRTQFDTIVNLAEFQKVRIGWSEKQSSGSVFHVISAVSEEYSYRPRMGGSVDQMDEIPVRTYKSETLAQFPEDQNKEAERAYNDLFVGLREGKTVFDMTVYISS